MIHVDEDIRQRVRRGLKEVKRGVKKVMAKQQKPSKPVPVVPEPEPEPSASGEAAAIPATSQTTSP